MNVKNMNVKNMNVKNMNVNNMNGKKMNVKNMNVKCTLLNIEETNKELKSLVEKMKQEAEHVSLSDELRLSDPKNRIAVFVCEDCRQKFESRGDLRSHVKNNQAGTNSVQTLSRKVQEIEKVMSEQKLSLASSLLSWGLCRIHHGCDDCIKFFCINDNMLTTCSKATWQFHRLKTFFISLYLF